MERTNKWKHALMSSSFLYCCNGAQTSTDRTAVSVPHAACDICSIDGTRDNAS